MNLTSSGFAIALSIALFFYKRKLTLEMLSKGGLHPIVLSTISGSFLGVWYYCFYRSIYNAQKVDATIIAFTWPLIAIIAMMIFYPKKSKPLLFHEWALILISFVGAVSIAFSGGHFTFFSFDDEIKYAFLAALASGLYLPFAIKAADLWRLVSSSPVAPTALAISIGNAVSLTVVFCLLWVFDVHLYFYAVDAEIILIAATIGIGIYIVAEIAWVWAFANYESLTISSLVYLSPVLSVLYLNLFFDEPISVLSAYGLLLVAFANLSLHSRYQFGNATFSSIIGTLFVGLSSYFIVPIEARFLSEAATLVGGLFAIVSGFILARANNRFRRQNELQMQLGGALHQLTRISEIDAEVVQWLKDTCDRIFQYVIDIEYEKSLPSRDRLINLVYDEIQIMNTQLLSCPAGEQYITKLDVIREQFEKWLSSIHERLSAGEKIATWSLCALSIMLVMLIRDESVVAYIVVLTYSFGALLVAFAVRDYDTSRAISTFTSFIVTQSFFKRIGRSYYLPAHVIESRDFPAPLKPEKFRVRSVEDESATSEVVISKPKGFFPIIYYSAFASLIFALILLPASRYSDFGSANIRNSIGQHFNFEPRKYILLNAQTTITVGVLDWDAAWANALVLSEIIREKFGVTVKVVGGTSDEIFAGMDRGDGSFDVHPDLWTMNQQENLHEFVENKATVVLNDVPYRARQGLYIPEYVAQDSKITAIADLKKPEMVHLFDSDGDGRGEYWPGARGWKSTNIWRAKFKAYGLDEYYEPIFLNDNIFKAKLQRDLAARRPILFYYWEPDWMHSHAVLQKIREPAFTGFSGKHVRNHPLYAKEGCFEMYQPRDTDDWLERSSVKCASPEVKVHIAFSRSLEARFPKVARFLKHYSPQEHHVTAWIFQIGRERVPGKEMARRWVEENRETVDSWVSR